MHGYNATGLDLIIKTAGVTKGNFYYYFKSKEALAVEAIEWHFSTVMEEVQEALSAQDFSPLESIFTILKVIEDRQLEQYADGKIRGCFFGNFTLEMSAGSPLVREKLNSVFSRYRDNFSQLLTQAQANGEASPNIIPIEEAETILSLVEGALLLDKARQESKALPQSINFLKTHLSK